jgi:hypothetical protein
MHHVLRLTALITIFVGTSIAWIVLGGVVLSRTDAQRYALHGSVGDLWGRELVQQAPTATWHGQHTVQRTRDRRDRDGHLVRIDGEVAQETYTTTEIVQTAQPLSSTTLDVDLALDQRRKGLLWFPLYDVDFQGTWVVTVGSELTDGQLVLDFEFPDANGIYDDFRFLVDGVEQADAHLPENGRVSVPVDAAVGDTVTFTIAYASRGMGSWQYSPGFGVAQLRDFHLAMATDFDAIDFPPSTLSPSTRERAGEGWALGWDFERLVTGNGMGMTMPTPVQPGPLAASMTFSAPISLGLFMVWIYALGLLKGVDLHPINHLFLAATFFSFHLLFSYSSDHLPVEAAFALSSVVSLFLTISYLRLVAGPRFALIEAGVAQFVYLVGFSLAHFWEGFTGLTVTLLGIVTLFALGQLTGRIRWTEVFAGQGAPPVPVDDGPAPVGS